MCINDDVLNGIATISNGDFRKSIILLQNLKYYKKKENTIFNENDIYDICNFINKDTLELYINRIKINNNVDSVIEITNEIINKGYVFNSVILKIIDYIIENKEISDSKKGNILFELSNVEKKINDGADELIQLISVFNNLQYVITDT
jgi:replication factor C subunit 2/4